MSGCVSDGMNQMKIWLWRIAIAVILCLALVVPSMADQMVLPADITEIEEEAFYGDQSLTELVLPEGLLRIGSKAFAETSLRSVTLPRSLQYFARDAFDFSGADFEVYVYAGSKAEKLCKEYGIRTKILENIKVGIINLDPSESGYREANVRDLQETFTAENGYDASFVTAPTADKQLQAAMDFIADGVKYILVSAAESAGWDDVLQEAKEAGIGVFLFDRMIECDPSLYTAAVVSDMAEEGKTAVAWLESLELPEYNILHIMGQMGSAAQVGRSGALEEKCAADDKWTIVADGTGGDSWDPEEARKIAQAAIKSGKKFNIVYAENDGMARGAVEALDAAGITHGVDGDVIIMGFDCDKWALRKLLAGEWNYNGQCSPFQAPHIDRMIKTLEAGGTITGLNSMNQFFTPEIGFDARTITEDDVEKYGLGD